MPGISLSVLKQGDPVPLGNEPLFLHYNGPHLRVIVLESGMQSGEPSVAIIAKTDKGNVIIETSLLAFNAAARGAVGMAETQLGWKMPP